MQVSICSSLRSVCGCGGVSTRWTLAPPLENSGMVYSGPHVHDSNPTIAVVMLLVLIVIRSESLGNTRETHKVNSHRCPQMIRKKKLYFGIILVFSHKIEQDYDVDQAILWILWMFDPQSTRIQFSVTGRMLAKVHKFDHDIDLGWVLSGHANLPTEFWAGKTWEHNDVMCVLLVKLYIGRAHITAVLVDPDCNLQ